MDKGKTNLDCRTWSDGRYYYLQDMNEFPESWMFFRFAIRHGLEVEQYSGQKDENGQKVYQGDHLEDEDGKKYRMGFQPVGGNNLPGFEIISLCVTGTVMSLERVVKLYTAHMKVAGNVHKNEDSQLPPFLQK